MTTLQLRQKLNRWHDSTGWQPFGFVLAALVLGVLLARLPSWWGVVLVAGTAVFLLTIIYPLAGLGLALLLGPLGALEKVLFSGSPLDSGQVMLLFAIAAWLARSLSRRRIMIRHSWLSVPLVVFIFVGALTLLDATAVTLGFIELVKWIEILVIMLMVTDLAAEWFEGRGSGFFGSPQVLVLGMLLLAGVSQALVGIWQFGLREDGPEHFLVLGRFYRAYGTFEQPNPFGGYMNLSVLLGLGVLLGIVVVLWRQFLLNRKGRKENSAKSVDINLLILFLCVGVATALTGLALLFSWSRGAWLGFVVGTAVVVLFWPRKLWRGIALLALAGMLLLGGLQVGLVPASVAERLVSFQEDFRFGDVRGVPINDTNYAVVERLAHWQAAFGMAQDDLWFGVGFGNYGIVYSDYMLSNWPDALGHAHNYYINLLAEIGVVGLGAYLLLWTAVIGQTIWLLRRVDGWERGIALGLLGVWTALAVHHMVDKLYVNNIYVHLGVMFGLLQILAILSKRQAKN
ncbi:MAG: O-antigen ligase family protein [Anaerolineae bacterium]|nr:O-antigen ligase family protein [Anaerolineae bacterium]